MILQHPKFKAFIERQPLDQDVVRVANALDKDHTNYEGKSILIVGCNEDPFANLLSELGAKVTGLDLREYSNTELDTGWDKPLYNHIVGDAVTHKFAQQFDIIISISVVEHIGLGWIQYGGVVNEDGDSMAMSNMHQALNLYGTMYITVPIGGSWKVTPHWRRYTPDTLDRLIGNASLISKEYFATSYNGSGTCTELEVLEYHAGADISVLLKLGK